MEDYNHENQPFCASAEMYNITRQPTYGIPSAVVNRVGEKMESNQNTHTQTCMSRVSIGEYKVCVCGWGY